MTDALIAKIGVENCAYHYDELYSFFVPQALAEKVAVGARVLVPFGKGNRAKPRSRRSAPFWTIRLY